MSALNRYRSASLIVLLTLTAGCGASTKDARVTYLETERKALQFRLKKMHATVERDEQAIQSRRKALHEARRFEKSVLEGEAEGAGDFLVIHESYFANLLDALLPLRWSADGFVFDFTGCEVEGTLAGMELRLPFKASGEPLRGASDQPPEGKVSFLLRLRHAEDGRLWFEPTPVKLIVDDRYYRAARLLQERFPADRFASLLPALPLPLGLPSRLQWQGKPQDIRVQLDPQRVLVLPERMLIPFSLHMQGASARARSAAPGPAAPAASEQAPATIPVGATPGRQPSEIPVGLTPGDQ